MGQTGAVVHGARAKVSINGQVIGIWTTFSYSFQLDVSSIYILGRFGPAALQTTAYEPVSITAGGWRVVDSSFFRIGGIPDLAKLLQQEDLLLAVEDRQTGKVIAEIKGCLPTGVSVNLSSKQLSDGTNTYLGLVIKTEDWSSDEGPGAATLPT